MADKNLGSGFVSELESGFLASGFTTADTSTNYTETLLSDQGAMSDTYRRKSQSGKIEIVKRIKSKYKDNETYKQLFIQEFNVLDGMQNEYVVSIHNHGKDSQGLFYVMEYVDGKTLAQIIKDNDIKDLSGKLNILRQLLDGLQYVHDKGVVHRDLKPDNIMVGNRTKNVKIIDFGLAISDSFPDNLATAGTPKYMSPEQKKDAKKADHLSDIYAFGIIMKEFLGDKSADVPQYKSIIEKCTKDNKSERYQNCVDILTDLADKNKNLSPELKALILEIVKDGIVTDAEYARLDAEIIADNYDKDLVYKELKYQLEKRRVRLALYVVAFVAFVVIVVWISFFKRPSESSGEVSDTTKIEVPQIVVEEPIPQEQLPVDNPPNDDKSRVSDSEKPVVVDPNPPVDKPSKPILDYGTFDGTIVNGEPNGQGTLIYSKEHLYNKFDDQKRKAMPGDKVFGDFKGGNLIQGEVTHHDGSTEFLMIGGQ